MSFWTDESVAELKRLHRLNYSFSQIAAGLQQFGAASRNACIGKVSRLGLDRRIQGRAPGIPVRGTKRRPLTSIALKPKPQPRKHGVYEPIAEPAITDLPPDTSDCAVMLIDARDEQCRWPLGEPSAFMLVCGAPCEGTYCARHSSIAYTEPWKRRRVSA